MATGTYSSRKVRLARLFFYDGSDDRTHPRALHAHSGRQTNGIISRVRVCEAPCSQRSNNFYFKSLVENPGFYTGSYDKEKTDTDHEIDSQGSDLNEHLWES